MYIRILPDIKKLTEAKEAFGSSDIQFNIEAAHIISMHALRGGMDRRGFKYLHLRKKGVLYPDDLVKRN